MMLVFAVLVQSVLTQAQMSEFLQPRIIGGKEVSPLSIPFVAALVGAKEKSSYDGQFCGATIIGPRHALTAAHCVDLEKNCCGQDARQPLAVEASRHNLNVAASKEDGQRSVRNLVVNIFVHPGGLRQGHDVAVLELERKYDWFNETDKVWLNTDLSLHGAHTTVVAAGWGKLSNKMNKDDSAESLNSVELAMIDHDTCKSLYDRAGYKVRDSELCAGDGNFEGGKDSCSGDSGGPLMKKVALSNGEVGYAVIGIVSWGHKCAKGKKPGVYASVAHHFQWIIDAVNTAPTPPQPPSGRKSKVKRLKCKGSALPDTVGFQWASPAHVVAFTWLSPSYEVRVGGKFGKSGLIWSDWVKLDATVGSQEHLDNVFKCNWLITDTSGEYTCSLQSGDLSKTHIQVRACNEVGCGEVKGKQCKQKKSRRLVMV